jgi:hypothetical protein
MLLKPHHTYKHVVRISETCKIGLGGAGMVPTHTHPRIGQPSRDPPPATCHLAGGLVALATQRGNKSALRHTKKDIKKV